MDVVVTDEQGLHRAEVFSAPYTVPTEQAGGAQGMGEGTLLHQLTPADHRHIPYHMGSCSAVKIGGRLMGVVCWSSVSW